MSDDHIVKSYDEELHIINDAIVQMGSLTESLLEDSMNAITKMDKDSVSKIVESDKKINKFRASIDEQIMTLLVKRSPVAIDLRLAISTLKISQDLERIGDLAKGNAKKILPLPEDDLPPEMLNSMRRLGEAVQKQIKLSLDSYLERSTEKAIQVVKDDEQVNDLTKISIKEVLDFLAKDKKNLEFATNLLFVSKNLERAGDHITRIAENVYYLISGDYPKKNK
ncbi:phosphate signaling complex protein PhoU [Pelagibacteraceae bacterium]|jgi:phosphate transport system protein|nr:phosphate signaling complex protein PhoU [Pelagibacteraceae bacterium]